MPRIFRPNAYFEEEVKQGKLFPKELESRNAVLESAFLVLGSIQKEFGEILSHSRPREDWIRYWKEKGIHIQSPIYLSDLNKFIQNKDRVDIEEWGKISRWNSDSGLEIDPDLLSSARTHISKLEQNEWNTESYPDFFSYSIRNFEDWKSFLEKENQRISKLERLMFKPENGFAGTHKIKSFSLLSDTADYFLKIRKEAFLAEPFVRRTKDFSLLFSANDGEFQIEAGTVLLNDLKGKYSGTWLGKFSEIEDYLYRMSETFSRIKEFHPNYQGFGSIDSFFYDSFDSVTLRKVSEINFRWTMGRLVLELSRNFPKQGNELLLFLPKVTHSDPYKQCKILEKETGWEIYPLSPFFSKTGGKNPKNLVWFRLPAEMQSDPWESAKIASESGIRLLCS
ncbi:hypothetical protein [Leptospira sarikeiensis]|uniref:ATP-grasp domain-containing protein n=1 Tax=Leptospira sarikeiensis TaxID=2484943 RepID=A0A4R9K5M9_9LEPT|nr:hypothetical protein [Leptospira sarikeiensis]TGL60833.1 hypothetical protein EHQ64_13560 [Leptospira sarikeiensis]